MALARQISEALTQQALAPQAEGLAGFLKSFAASLLALPGIRGSLVAALDKEGTPYAVGEHHLLAGSGEALVQTFSLIQEVIGKKAQGIWIEVPATALNLEEGRGNLALFVNAASHCTGFLIVNIERESQLPTETLDALSENAPLLALALQSMTQGEAWARFEELQRLAEHTFTQEPWNFQEMVEHLRRIFDAGAVTMFLQDQEELRLAASTDPRLSEHGPVIYKPGEGLTGYVFQSGKSVRLNDTKDQDVFRLTGLMRSGPRFPERDPKGSPTEQFLGVPMRFGDKVVGVLRMSRRKGVVKFSRQDERALQFFADLLGAAIAPAMNLLLARSMLESVTEAAFVSRLDSEGRHRIIMANQGAEKLLARQRLEIEGLDAREFYDPGEYERLRQELRPAREVVYQTGHAEYGPILSKMTRADHTLVPVSISYRLLANRLVQPPTFYTIGLARDISEVEIQAEQHQRLLELLDAMRIAYFRADPDGITEESTSADSEITGYSFEELKSMPRMRLYSESTRRDHLLERARENQGHVYRMLIQMRRKNNELFWAEGDLRILKDPFGREIGSEGLYRDVTDRIRLQGFLNTETKKVLADSEIFTELEKDAELQLDYLSSLSHQLQTPLGSLIGTLRNFEKGEISQKILQQRLPYAIGQAVVCTRLVRNLSYMDKILRGEAFEKQNVSIAKLAIQTKLDFLHLLEEKKLEIRIDDESIERNLSVLGHQEMLRQVLVNLVDNAIKYSFSNTTIIIRGRLWPEGNALEISNQGLPLSVEQREKIFERGFRAKEAQAAVPHGTGLGLWLVRKIVEAHGATIRCLETLEGGKKRTLFRILFPNPPTGSRRAS